MTARALIEINRLKLCGKIFPTLAAKIPPARAPKDAPMAKAHAAPTVPTKRGAIEKVAATASTLAKAHGGKIAAGAAVAGILYGGYKLYKAWKAKGDAAKGKKAQAANLKANLAKCNKSADPAKCKAAIQKKIASLK